MKRIDQDIIQPGLLWMQRDVRLYVEVCASGNLQLGKWISFQDRRYLKFLQGIRNRIAEQLPKPT